MTEPPSTDRIPMFRLEDSTLEKLLAIAARLVSMWNTHTLTHAPCFHDRAGAEVALME